MDTFRATAFYLALWYAILAALGAVLLIALNDVEPATGFLIAANVALLFALALVAAVGRLSGTASRAASSGAACRPRNVQSGKPACSLACRALHDT